MTPLKTVAAVSILTIKVYITRAPVKECSAFRIKRCSTTLLTQSVLQIELSDLFSLHYVSDNMCWCYLSARQRQIVKSIATSIEPGQHSHMCSLTRLYTVGCLYSIFHPDFPLKFTQQFAALCHYFIVFFESIIEALIHLMKNKFTYIKTIVLLVLCKYNTQHAEFNLFI